MRTQRVYKPATLTAKLFAFSLGLGGFCLLAWGFWQGGSYLLHWLREASWPEIPTLADIVCDPNCTPVKLKGLNKIAEWFGSFHAWAWAVVGGWLLVMWGMVEGDGTYEDAEVPGRSE